MKTAVRLGGWTTELSPTASPADNNSKYPVDDHDGQSHKRTQNDSVCLVSILYTIQCKRKERMRQRKLQEKVIKPAIGRPNDRLVWSLVCLLMPTGKTGRCYIPLSATAPKNSRQFAIPTTEPDRGWGNVRKICSVGCRCIC